MFEHEYKSNNVQGDYINEGGGGGGGGNGQNFAALIAFIALKWAGGGND